MPDAPDIVVAPTATVDRGVVALWLARVGWLAVALVGGRAVGEAVAARSDAVQLVATVGAWVAWGIGAVALAVTGLPSLTTLRVIIPGAVVVAGVAAVAGAPASAVLTLLGPALATTAVACSAEIGQRYVQASAYGDERRFPLRPPFGYLVAVVVSWAIWVAAVITAPLAWTAGGWILAATASVVAVATTWVLPSRWHQLSRRWFVLVPAGLVVHDPVVLAETLMVLRPRITRVGLVAPARGNGAFDLTGPTPGAAIGVVVDEMITATLAPRPTTPRGTAVHLSAFVVAPSRPGAALREAARRRLPVS